MDEKVAEIDYKPINIEHALRTFALRSGSKVREPSVGMPQTEKILSK